MARVWSSNAFNIDKYDFHGFMLDFMNAGATEIEHGTPTTINGATYSSWMDFSFGDRRVILAGDNLVFDDPTNGPWTITGTIRAITGSATADGSNQGAGLQGISVSLASLLEAAESPDKADDLALLRAELAGDDSFRLSGGGDLARGFGGDDLMEGRDGGDRLHGGTGTDRLFGERGADRLWGDGGNDTLRGGAGGDVLSGGAGADTLVGGRGFDRLYGGNDSVRDVFVFNDVSDSPTGYGATVFDRIYGFDRGTDKLDLRGIDAKPDTPADDPLVLSGDKATPSVWWNFGSTATEAGALVAVDVTGEGDADLEIFVIGVSSLSAGDFLL